MSHERKPQKAPTFEHRTRAANNRPDAPLVSVNPEHKLSINSPQNVSSINNGAEVKKIRKDGGYGRDVTVFEISPLVKEAIIPAFKRNKIGGGMVGGGGTSKEALRRAKRKARNSSQK